MPSARATTTRPVPTPASRSVASSAWTWFGELRTIADVLTASDAQSGECTVPTQLGVTAADDDRVWSVDGNMRARGRGPGARGGMLIRARSSQFIALDDRVPGAGPFVGWLSAGRTGRAGADWAPTVTILGRLTQVPPTTSSVELSWASIGIGAWVAVKTIVRVDGLAAVRYQTSMVDLASVLVRSTSGECRLRPALLRQHFRCEGECHGWSWWPRQLDSRGRLLG